MGPGHWHAEHLRSNSHLGYSEVLCTAWEIMAGTPPRHTSPCYRACPGKSRPTFDQPQRESLLLVLQHGLCMFNMRRGLPKEAEVTQLPSVRETKVWFMSLSETLPGKCCSYIAQSSRDITPFSLTNCSSNVVGLSDAEDDHSKRGLSWTVCLWQFARPLYVLIRQQENLFVLLVSSTKICVVLLNDYKKPTTCTLIVTAALWLQIYCCLSNKYSSHKYYGYYFYLLYYYHHH